MSFAIFKNLDKISVKGASINKVPGLGNDMIGTEKFKTASYFMKNPKGVFKMVFGSKDADFDKLGFVQIYGSDLKKNVLFSKINESKTIPAKVLAKLVVNVSRVNPKYIDKLILKKVSKESLEKALLKNKKLTEDVDPSEEFEKNSKKVKRALWWAKFSGKVTFYSTLIAGVLTIFFFLWNLFKDVKYKLTTKLAMSTLENKVNKTLFQGQTGEESAFDDFSRLSNSVKNLVTNAKSKSLILTGPPGMSKTYTVRRTLHFLGKKPGKDYIFMRGGSVSTGELYQMLYDHRTKLIVLDDFDSPLKDPTMINILKSVTDSYNIRIVTVPQERGRASAGADEPSSKGLKDLPTRFEFKGKILVVTNLMRRNLDKALISRAPTLEVNYDSKKILAIMKKIMKYMLPSIPMKTKQEAVNYAASLQSKYPSKVKLDFRALQQCMEVRVSMPDEWKDLIRIILGVD